MAWELPVKNTSYDPVSQFKFARINIAVTSPLANQPVSSESECARDHCQSVAVTPAVNLSFSLLSPAI